MWFVVFIFILTMKYGKENIFIYITVSNKLNVIKQQEVHD